MKKYFYLILLTLIITLIGCQTQDNQNENHGIENDNNQQDEQTKQLDEEAPDENKEEKEQTKTKSKKDSKKKQQDLVDKTKTIVYDIFKVGNMSMDDTIISTTYNKKEKSISFTVKGKGGRSSEKSIRTGLYKDTTEVFRQLSIYDELDMIWLGITLPMEDVYGCEDEVEVMSTWMSRETMDAVDWNSFDYHDLPNTADQMMVCPHLTND